MSTMTFEEQLTERIQQAMLKQVSDIRLVDYSACRMQVPEDLIQRAWDTIDWDDTLDTIKDRLQESICSVVVNSMLTEMKTDTKKILAIEGVRQNIKETVYPRLMRALDGR